jgi:hypothetical protein
MGMITPDHPDHAAWTAWWDSVTAKFDDDEDPLCIQCGNDLRHEGHADGCNKK